MKKENYIDTLKEALINKKVTNISEGFGEACVCQIDTDKNSILIYANDLGTWVKQINYKNNFIEFTNMLSMLLMVCKTEKPIDFINFKDNYLFVFSGDLKFRCEMNHDWEKKIIKSKNGIKFIQDIIWFGLFMVTVLKDYKHYSGFEYLDENEDLSITEDYLQYYREQEAKK